MTHGAQLSVTDMRQAARHPVEFPVIGEHRDRVDLPMHIVNVSAQGFMIDNCDSLTRGERVTIRLPEIGHIEAHVIWVKDERAGFQFERIIRLEEFRRLIDALQPNPRLRRTR